MIKIVIGVLLIFGGIMSLTSDVGIIWTGGFIVGFSMIVSGLKDTENTNKVNTQIEKLKQNWEDLLSRIENNQSIDEIASDYYRKHNIPPLRTIIVAAHLVKLLADSGDENALMLAAFISSKQIVDSNISPEETISKFSFIDQVYFVDHKVTYYCHPKTSDEKPKIVNGTLILSKGYLFFFPNKGAIGADEFMDALNNARGLHPLLAIVSDGYSLVSGISKQLEEYFSIERISAYKQRFAEENSFAIPLVDIVGLGHRENKGRFLSSSLLQISVKNEEFEEEITYLISNDSGSRKWVSKWWERVQLACIVESNLLIRIPQKVESVPTIIEATT